MHASFYFLMIWRMILVIMYETFEQCARALLNNKQLDEAKGGLITINNNRFDYSLHGQPEQEGDPFLGIYPSATPEAKWRVVHHKVPESEDAYRAFTANPENGEFI
jgi:hypothetical protein